MNFLFTATYCFSCQYSLTFSLFLIINLCSFYTFSSTPLAYLGTEAAVGIFRVIGIEGIIEVSVVLACEVILVRRIDDFVDGLVVTTCRVLLLRFPSCGYQAKGRVSDRRWRGTEAGREVARVGVKRMRSEGRRR